MEICKTVGRINVRRCTGLVKLYPHNLSDLNVAECGQNLALDHCFIRGKVPGSDNLLNLHLRALQIEQARAQILRRPLLAVRRSAGRVRIELCGIKKKNSTVSVLIPSSTLSLNLGLHKCSIIYYASYNTPSVYCNCVEASLVLLCSYLVPADICLYGDRS